MTHLEMGMEGLVDRFGIQAVVEALGNVCLAKEERVATWQDMALARKWRALHRQLNLLDFRDL